LSRQFTELPFGQSAILRWQEFHKLQEFQQVTLKVLRWEERDKRLGIKDAEIVACATG
jgi:hypothetical protein